MNLIKKTVIAITAFAFLASTNAFAIIYTKHAKARMVERGLIGKDIERTLEIGDLFESQASFEDDDISGETKYIAIDRLREIAVVFDPVTNTIITAMREASEKWVSARNHKMTPVKVSTSLEDQKNENTRNILQFGKLWKFSKGKKLAYDPSTQIAVFYNRSGITKTTLIIKPSITDKGKTYQLIDEEPLEEAQVELLPHVSKLKGLSGKQALENYCN